MPATGDTEESARQPTSRATDSPKTARGRKKAAVTRSTGKLRRLISEEDAAALRDELTVLKQAFDTFEHYHDAYHRTLVSEPDIAESEEYFTTAENDYVTAVTSAKKWLAQVKDTDQTNLLLDVLSLPKVELEPFNGDPLVYNEFISIFDENVHNKSINDSLKLTRLLQFTTGEAKDAIRHCSLIGGTAGYRKARKLLSTRFGNSYTISHTILDNLKNGKSVSSALELRRLADELVTASETLRELKLFSELDNQKCIVDILQRLPNTIRNSWRSKALETKHEKSKYPNFDEFVSFVDRKATDSLDPVYGACFSKQSNVKPRISTCHTMAHSSDRRSVSLVCIVCEQNHNLLNCDKFKSMKPQARLDVVKSNKLCFLCLFPGHSVSACQKAYRCSVPNCGKKHSKFIHVDTQQSRSDVTSVPLSSETFEASASNASVKNNASRVYLPIVSVTCNGSYTAHALLDSGSTNTFISESLAKRLNLKSKKTNYNVNTLSSNTRIKSMVSLQLSPLDGASSVKLNALVISDIPAAHPASQKCVDISKYPHLHDIPISNDPSVMKADILIGMDNAHLLVPYEVKSNPSAKNEPFATRTYFGWALSGPVFGQSNQAYVNFIQGNIEKDIESMWTIEHETGESSESELSLNDRKVLDLWDEQTIYENNRYTVPIPWKEGKPNLPNNVSQACHRLHSLHRRLQKSGNLDQYDEQIHKFVDKGYAEKVPENEIDLKDGSVFYLPHHGVFNQTKGKLRVVMDCSAQFNGISLNNSCLQGPDLVNKLLHVLIRFRQYKYAALADVEAMYMQVKVPIKDRNALRFLWFDDQINPIHYRMTSHLFGGVWCSSASTYALRKTCEDNATSDMVRDVICKSAYVDDFLPSFKSVDEAIVVMRETKQVLSHGGFNLTKFVVNDSQLLTEIAVADRAKEVSISPCVSKALGIHWDVTGDYFYYVNQSVVDTSRVTRRSVLKQVASMYDPLGVILPVIIQGRIIFQESTRLRLHWDSPLPESLTSKWLSWLQNLQNLSEIHVDRCLVPTRFIDGAASLYHFCDSSRFCYGACSYLRIVNKHGEIRVVLLMSRARLAPLKQLTIPRLELCAAVLAVRLDVILRRELDIPLLESTFFTDSEIVRAYIMNDDKRYKVFIGNRVAEIRRHSSMSQWFHIDGKSNPADVLSRGCAIKDLPSNWVSGPDFLYRHKCDWPVTILPSTNAERNVTPDENEVLPVTSNVVISHEGDVIHPLDKLIAHYGSFYSLKKAVCWLLRALTHLKGNVIEMHVGPLTMPELKHAESVLLTHVQSVTYEVELENLKRNEPVQKSSPIIRLDPMLYDGLIVVGGRLRHSSEHVIAKHPVIVPSKHQVAHMIVSDVHNYAHLGVEWTLSHVRRKYWITDARSIIKRVKKTCVTCKKLYAPPEQQKMADLPTERCEPYLPPFTHVGFDIFGNYYVKFGRSQAKRYCVIFTCFNTRAVHIEVIESLETDAFINALVRFVARRGSPSKVFCDNASTFLGARNELSKSLRQLNRDKIVQTARRLDIEWVFNVPLASHHGGVWERLIRTVRRVLAAIIHPDSRLTDDTLRTFMCEVENVINGRPITKSSDDVNDEAALTPNHFLLLRDDSCLPCGVFHDSDKYRRRWRHVQFLVNTFWKRWLLEYLPLLQTRQKWFLARSNVNIGDLVLIVDENAPRGCWPLGLVTDVVEGRDGLVRSVKMLCRGKSVTRPITKIVLLECARE